MPSNTRAVRESQRDLYDQRLQVRRAELEKKGIAPKDFNKDKVYEHLKAKRRDIVNALAAIEQVRVRNEASKQAAAEPEAPVPDAPKEKKAKKEKAAPAKAAKAAKAAK
jgi:hypothetical protein